MYCILYIINGNMYEPFSTMYSTIYFMYRFDIYYYRLTLSLYIYTCVCVSFILDYISIARSHIIFNNTTLHDIMLYCAMLGHMVYYMISIVYYF